VGEEALAIVEGRAADTVARAAERAARGEPVAVEAVMEHIYA
jgi:hypothetical protein